MKAHSSIYGQSGILGMAYLANNGRKTHALMQFQSSEIMKKPYVFKRMNKIFSKNNTSARFLTNRSPSSGNTDASAA
jgi:hypothetical protein